MRRWILVLVLLTGVAVLAGCGSHHDTDRERLFASIGGLMSAWATQNSAYLDAYISNDSAFDEQNKADHIAAIVADFPDISDFRLVRRTVDIISPNLASAQVEFSVTLVADIAALDQPLPIFAAAPSDNLLNQVWIKDFDGVWRLAAEFLEGSWVLDDRPVINAFSVQPGDRIAPGATASFGAIASDSSNLLRVSLFPSSDAAASFAPDSAFGFGSAIYNGDITVRTDALGEYSFAVIGQTDIPGNPRMLGRLLRAVYIVVSDSAVRGRLFVGGKTVPGNRQSLFRRVGIRRAAAQYRQQAAQRLRPGAAR